VAELAISPLAAYGMTASDIPVVVQKARQASSMKGNPSVLADGDLAAILEAAVTPSS
jgi:alcohol dehydrogenase class IV